MRSSVHAGVRFSNSYMTALSALTALRVCWLCTAIYSSHTTNSSNVSVNLHQGITPYLSHRYYSASEGWWWFIHRAQHETDITVWLILHCDMKRWLLQCKQKWHYNSSFTSHFKNVEFCLWVTLYSNTVYTAKVTNQWNSKKSDPVTSLASYLMYTSPFH